MAPRRLVGRARRVGERRFFAVHGGGWSGAGTPRRGRAGTASSGGEGTSESNRPQERTLGGLNAQDPGLNEPGGSGQGGGFGDGSRGDLERDLGGVADITANRQQRPARANVQHVGELQHAASVGHGADE